MSRLLRFLGLTTPDGTASREPTALRDIEQRLDHLSPERARFFAAFAYVLARVAAADLRVDASEQQEMSRILVEVVGLTRDEAILVAEIAEAQVDELGATHNYSVTREFGSTATRDAKLRLLRCLFAVAAADENITGAESIEIMNVAQEIGLPREDVIALRAEFRDHLAELRKLPGER